MYQSLFMRGFMRALTREENEELETSILNETINEIKKMVMIFFILYVLFFLYFLLILLNVEKKEVC